MAVQFWVTHNYMVNVSNSSTPLGLYRVRSVQLADLRKGDLVALRMPVKLISALPGQLVRFTPQGVYVEHALLPNSAPEKDMTQVCPYGSYTVPPFMFLGMGLQNPDSWDGRYQCFLPQSLIEGKVTRTW